MTMGVLPLMEIYTEKKKKKDPTIAYKSGNIT